MEPAFKRKRMNEDAVSSRSYRDTRRRQDDAHGPDPNSISRGTPPSFQKEQARINQAQEAEQMREWVAKEDEFVLAQSKKKAHIRAREGRAKAIDWLAVALEVLSIERDPVDEERDDTEIEVISPTTVFEDLDLSELKVLDADISAYLALETKTRNRLYWNALKTICEDHMKTFQSKQQQISRTTNSVATEIDSLLRTKTLPQLVVLENQILQKLGSNQAIDVDYWEQLLKNVAIYKAKADLSEMWQTIMQARLKTFRRDQCANAVYLGRKLELVLTTSSDTDLVAKANTANKPSTLKFSPEFDPESTLTLSSGEKALPTTTNKEFVQQLNEDRERVKKQGYVSTARSTATNTGQLSRAKAPAPSISTDHFASATDALYDREAARGVQEDEEIFATEEQVTTKSTEQWTSKYRPRKPRYFNRVQMGYEWNKYNQTHYDHDNPPPKVVQGYKFNIFYPDLIDKIKAPTYKIEREGGRRRGESFAPAGEEDTCLIRFISGPPYEDIAFRIVDREWDFSSKRDRGFKSSFDKGILQLHFQFKKVYYRK